MDYRFLQIADAFDLDKLKKLSSETINIGDIYGTYTEDHIAETLNWVKVLNADDEYTGIIGMRLLEEVNLYELVLHIDATAYPKEKIVEMTHTYLNSILNLYNLDKVCARTKDAFDENVFELLKDLGFNSLGERALFINNHLHLQQYFEYDNDDLVSNIYHQDGIHDDWEL